MDSLKRGSYVDIHEKDGTKTRVKVACSAESFADRWNEHNDTLAVVVPPAPPRKLWKGLAALLAVILCCGVYAVYCYSFTEIEERVVKLKDGSSLVQWEFRYVFRSKPHRMEYRHLGKVYQRFQVNSEGQRHGLTEYFGNDGSVLRTETWTNGSKPFMVRKVK